MTFGLLKIFLRSVVWVSVTTEHSRLDKSCLKDQDLRRVPGPCTQGHVWPEPDSIRTEDSSRMAQMGLVDWWTSGLVEWWTGIRSRA